MKSYSFKWLMAAIFLISAFLVACGGGGGSSGDVESGGTDTDPDPNQDVDNVANRGLTGQLYFYDYSDDVYLIDAATGLVKYVPNTDWENQDERFPSGVSSFYAHSRTNDNTEFLVTSVRCKRANSDPLSDKLSCLVIQDYQGNYHSQFDVAGEVYEGGKLSPDGQYIALFRDLDPGGGNQVWFEIWTRDGRLVSERNKEQTEFIWLNDGRILYTYGPQRQFYFTRPYSTQSERYIQVPSTVNNESIGNASLGSVAVSPDNTQLAFTLRKRWESTGVYGDVVFIVNLDIEIIRKLAVSMRDDIHLIDNLTWSPDSRWLMVREGHSESIHSTPSTTGYYYAIPTEDLGKVFQLSIIDSERSPEVIQFRHDRNLTEPGVDMTENAISGVYLEWIP